MRAIALFGVVEQQISPFDLGCFIVGFGDLHASRVILVELLTNMDKADVSV